MESIDYTWDELVLMVSRHFKVTADYDFMLFIIGIQERGTGMTHYPREEKMDLINLGKCKLLSHLGYLEEIEEDQEGWPRFKEIKSVKGLSPSFQKHLLKKAMMEYFKDKLN
ncbi:hypothetical protein [Natronoflexus pectinivorans]|uniref:Uncharacterized protein n=1 Tax=Natronoflexus pectinivorans TaxID=682526 RepID=A0A4R2GMQ9_9BACT|nr:hypothetical protein [Natronoflexus pectinivorans]TCO10562.1 hypothetical protein EV194_101192 [Natronoflexus pectinivorans]